MLDDVGQWLKSFGLREYAEAFAENAVTFDLLNKLTEQDLKELGVSKLGHRKRLLEAIAALSRPGEEAVEAIPQESTPSRAEAERRQLTVMFCDLVDSTALSQQLDPEDLREVMQRYQNAVAGVVVRYEGHVAQFLGDGVLAYFGWPQAYEDQAEQAVRAGLDAVRAVRKIRLDGGRVLAARVGIASGHVVVGDLVGDTASDLKAVIGETPNLAARLQGVAEPGQVVIGATTHRLIGSAFKLSSLGLLDLKGFSKPVPTWLVEGEAVSRSRFEAAHTETLTRFVGREHEIGLLRERWDLAKGGEGQIVLLSGEAGIGKSRLVQTLRDQIADQPHISLRYQCSPHHTNSAFYPVIKQLERAARFSADDEPEGKLSKLETLLAMAEEDTEAAVPFFAALLSLPTDGRYGALDMSPEQRRDRIIEAMIGQLLALSRKRPVLFVLEDAHWIDPTTEALLGETMAQIADAAVLMLITHRPAYASPSTGHLHLTTIGLNRLGREQGAEIVHAVGGQELVRNLVDRIFTRADGVPLYLEELTKSVVEAGMSADDPTAADMLPTTLQASLTARLDRLGEAKEIVQIGAVIGRSFPHLLIAAISESSEESLNSALDRIVESELMSCRGVPPDAQYTFKHSLIRDAAYETLLRSKRQQYHGKVAEVLLRDFSAQAALEPELVARHLSLAGQPGKAVEYWLLAGQCAGERSAHVEAIADLEKGLQDLELLPESQSRDQHEFELRIALGASLLTMKGWSAPEVQKNYERAQGLSKTAGDIHKVIAALRGLTNVFFLKGEINEARKLADRELSIAIEKDDQTLLMGGYRSVGMCSFFVGDFEAAREYLQRSNSMYDPSIHAAQKFVQGTDPAVIGLSVVGWANWFFGDPKEAKRNVHTALNLAEELHHPFSLAYAQSLAASLSQCGRNPRATCEHAEAAIAIAEEHDYPYWLGWASVMRGWALSALGDPHKGIELLRHGLETYEHTGAQQIKPYILTMLAEMYGWAGLPQQGIKTVKGAYGAGNKSDVCFYEAEALRIKGELNRQVQTRDVSTYFERAMKLARRQGARMLELRAALSLARATGASADQGSTRELISELYRTIESDLTNPDLLDARDYLEACGTVQR